MNVIIGYISIVLYSDSSWSDTAISPEASFHMTPGKNELFSKYLQYFARKLHEIRYQKAHRSRESKKNL